MAVRFTKNSNRRNDVRHYRLVYSWPSLTSAGLSSNLAYITSVFIGYIGTDSIAWLINAAAKKAGVEDGRNCQRGVPRYAGVVGGTDNGRQKPEIMVMTSL